MNFNLITLSRFTYFKSGFYFLKKNFRIGIILTIATSTATLISGLTNFVFNIFNARILGPDQFGILVTILAVSSIFSVGFSGIQLDFAQRVAVNRPYIRVNFFSEENKKILLFALLSALTLLCLSPLLALLLKTSTISTSSLSLIIFSSILYISGIGRLQGASKFVEWQYWGVAITVVKFAGGVVTAYLTQDVRFVLFFIGLFQILVSLTILYRTSVFSLKEKIFSLKLIRSVLVMLFMWIAFQLDVIVVRIFYSGIESGYYAAAGLIGKATPLVIGTIGVFLLPKIANLKQNGQNSRFVYSFVAVVSIVISLVAILLIVFFQDQLFNLLFKQNYQRAKDFFIPLSIAAIPWCLVFSLLYAKMGDPSKRLYRVSALPIIVALPFYLVFDQLDAVPYIHGFTGLLANLILLYSILKETDSKSLKI